MALVKEMFGLAVTLVPQGCMVPYEEDPVRAFIAPSFTLFTLFKLPFTACSKCLMLSVLSRVNLLSCTR